MPFASASYLLRENRDRPVFLWVHIWPPHYPFEVLPEFKGRFLDAGVEVNEVMGRYTEAQEPERCFYEGKIRRERPLCADHALKIFIKSLKESGQYENSIVIVSADHGETLGAWLLDGPLAAYVPRVSFVFRFLFTFPDKKLV